MKKFIILITIFLVPVYMWAQDTPLSSLYSKYVSEPGFETTEILPGSTGFEWEQNIHSEHIKDMVKDIESIRILEYKGEGKFSTEKLWKKMSAAASGGDYTEVVNVSGDDKQASVYMLKESEGLFREIALMAKQDDGITLITVTGDIDVKKIFSPETMESLRELSGYMRGKGDCEVK